MSLTLIILESLSVILSYLIYKFVKLEYEESLHGNYLLKKLLRSRKRATVKRVLTEMVKPAEDSGGQ